jgi:hypothetical protein
MSTKPIHRIELSLVLLVLAVGLGAFALIQAPGLFGEAAPSSPEYAANRRRIEQMTPAERDRIKHRAAKFAALSESRRNELRKLHSQLQNDPDANELQEVLDRYNAWLTSLPVDERDKLRAKLATAKSPEQQRQIVADTKREIDIERLLKSAPLYERRDYRRERDPQKKQDILARIRETYAYGSQRSRGPTLKPDELDAVVNVIEGQLKPTPKQSAEWRKLEPGQRRLKIMIAALQEHSRRATVGRMVYVAASVFVPVLNERLPRRRRPEPGLLSDARFEDAALRDRLLKEYKFRWRGPSWRPPNFRILSLVNSTLYADRREESENASEEQLGRFFEKLTDRQMEELQQSPERMKTLKRWYFFSGGKDGDVYRTYVTQFYSVVRFGGFRKEPGGQRTGKPGGRRGARGRSGEPPRGRR